MQATVRLRRQIFGSRMVEYAGKLCLAPMVRSGEIPTRLMALRHGADLVWSPEIVDKKLVRCDRVVNEALGTVDFVETGAGKVAFRTFPTEEQGRLIFQLGSSDPDLAAEAALKVIHDVDGIDLNCGCPKSFSTHSGMGAALLTNPDLLESILTTLVRKVGKPHNKSISCKIRLLSETDPVPSMVLIEMLCKTGIANLTLHCRTKTMRNREAPIRHFLPQIIDLVRSHNVSFIINGAVQSREEFDELQEAYGPDIGGMIAESAEANPTVFSRSPLPYNEVIPEFIKIAKKFDNHPSNTKYIILNQLPGKSKFYQEFCKAKTHDDYLKVAQRIGDEGNRVITRYLQKHKLSEPSRSPRFEDDEIKKRKMDVSTDISDEKRPKYEAFRA